MTDSINNSLPGAKKSLHLGLGLWRVRARVGAFRTQLLREGALSMAIVAHGRRQMEKAALQLPTIEPNTALEPLEIHFLSGRNFWYQTCFCAYSMARQAEDARIRPVIYDDGSLSEQYAQRIRKVFPDARIIDAREIESRLEESLPQSKFPFLRQTRQHYFHLRKLTDVHAGLDGWKLVLDSDMLFFRRPTFLLEWLKSPQQPCYVLDVETAYGYSNALMSSLVKTEMPERVNVGVCGLKSEDIDWEKIEYWAKTLTEKEGSSYLLEQGLTAMFLADKKSVIGSREDYLVYPLRDEVEVYPRNVLQHYVGKAKDWYFRFAWKHVLRGNNDEPTLS